MGSANSLLQGAGPSAPQFCVGSCLFMRTVHTLYRRTTKFDVITHTGMELVFRGQPRPHPKRAGSGTPQFLGFSSICAYTFCRTTKFGMGYCNTWGEACILESATPHPRERSTRAPQFWGFSYSLLNAEWPNSAG